MLAYHWGKTHNLGFEAAQCNHKVPWLHRLKDNKHEFPACLDEQVLGASEHAQDGGAFCMPTIRRGEEAMNRASCIDLTCGNGRMRKLKSVTMD